MVKVKALDFSSCLNQFLSALDIFEDSTSKGFGILLSHSYMIRSVQQRSLKGVDANLIESIVKHWPSAHLESVLVHSYHSFYPNDNSCGPLDSFSIYSLNIVDDSDRNNVYVDEDTNCFDMKSILKDKMPFFIGGQGTCLKTFHQQGAEYTGNQSLEEIRDHYYFHAAIIVDPRPRDKKTPENADG